MSEQLTEENGWVGWGFEEPFEDMAGPFFMKLDKTDGKHLSAFKCGPQHLNGAGSIHGGMLMVFADYALFVIAHDELDDINAVTLTCQTDFLAGAAPLGEIVYADGEVTRNTRSLIFIRGQIRTKDTLLSTFTGIVKKLKPQK